MKLRCGHAVSITSNNFRSRLHCKTSFLEISQVHFHCSSSILSRLQFLLIFTQSFLVNMLSQEECPRCLKCLNCYRFQIQLIMCYTLTIFKVNFFRRYIAAIFPATIYINILLIEQLKLRIFLIFMYYYKPSN